MSISIIVWMLPAYAAAYYTMVILRLDAPYIPLERAWKTVVECSVAVAQAGQAGNSWVITRHFASACRV